MTNPLRLTARVLTGSTYAVLGFDAFRTPGGRVGQAAGTLARSPWGAPRGSPLWS